MTNQYRSYPLSGVRIVMLAIVAFTFSLAVNAATLDADVSAQPGTGQGCFLVNTAHTSSALGPMTLTHGCNDVAFNGKLTGAISTIVDYGLVATDAEISARSNRPFNISNTLVVASQARADYQFSGPSGSTFASLNLEVEGQIDGPVQPFGARVLANGIDRTFTAGVIDQILHGQSFEVSTLTPTPIVLSFRISIGTGSFDGSLQTVGVSGPDGYFVVGFENDGPVFSLPAGFTVNGPCVTDNRYTCSPSFAAVPLPPSLGLMVAGVLLLARVRHSRGLRRSGC